MDPSTEKQDRPQDASRSPGAAIKRVFAFSGLSILPLGVLGAFLTSLRGAPVPNAIGVLVVLAPCLIFMGSALLLLIRFFFLQTQAHLVEVLFTLVAGALSLGVMLKHNSPGLEYTKGIGTVLFFLIAAVPAVLIFTGALWGFSSARRLGEARPWHRLGLIICGWGLMAGIGAFPLFAFHSYAMATRTVTDARLLAWGQYFVLTVLGVPGVIIEWKCRALGRREEL